MSAYFLTKEEKIIAIERLRNQSTGIENKTWKKEQFIEALTDWKPWASLPQSWSSKSSLMPEPLWALATSSPSRHFTSISSTAHSRSIISGIMIVSLPWSNKGGLLTAIYLGGVGTPGFVLALSWCAATNTGLGNLLAPQMWEAKYAPRYYVPWGVILATYVLCPVILLGIGFFLRRENRRRDRLTASGEIVVEKFYDERGEEVDSTFLDITDRNNLAYRYPL
ncbi:hypothetical protein P7C73_g5191, partial [Tremellales sp. Uapishka_1]